MIELKMDFFVGNLCVDIKIWSKKEEQFKKALAIFDTGAHTTHIDTNTLKLLGYDLDNAAKSFINTVGSSNIRVKNTVIDNIKIGDLELGAVSVNFSELSDVATTFILGMNVIKEFNIKLDFKNEIIYMEPNFDIDSATPPELFNKIGSRFGMWVMGIEKVI